MLLLLVEDHTHRRVPEHLFSHRSRQQPGVIALALGSHDHQVYNLVFDNPNEFRKRISDFESGSDFLLGNPDSAIIFLSCALRSSLTPSM